MEPIKHMIVPGKGTQLVQHGMTIEEVVKGVGPFDENYDRSNAVDPFLGYLWHAQDLHVRTDPQSGLVNWIMFHPKANLYLGDVRVFDMPNLVILFAMHDPNPFDAGAVNFPRLGVQVEEPDPRTGYATMHTGTGSFCYVKLNSEREIEKLLTRDPPFPKYDWKEWLKPNLKDKYGPAEE